MEMARKPPLPRRRWVDLLHGGATWTRDTAVALAGIWLILVTTGVIVPGELFKEPQTAIVAAADFEPVTAVAVDPEALRLEPIEPAPMPLPGGGSDSFRDFEPVEIGSAIQLQCPFDGGCDSGVDLEPIVVPTIKGGFLDTSDSGPLRVEPEVVAVTVTQESDSVPFPVAVGITVILAIWFALLWRWSRAKLRKAGYR